MTELSLDVLLELVAHRRRRQTIHHLRHEVDGTTTIADLVDRLHSGESITHGQTSDREQIAIQLHHAHLPKLADNGVVEFDPENESVRYRPDDRVESVLDSLSEELSVASP